MDKERVREMARLKREQSKKRAAKQTATTPTTRATTPKREQGGGREPPSVDPVNARAAAARRKVAAQKKIAAINAMKAKRAKTPTRSAKGDAPIEGAQDAQAGDGEQKKSAAAAAKSEAGAAGGTPPKAVQDVKTPPARPEASTARDTKLQARIKAEAARKKREQRERKNGSNGSSASKQKASSSGAPGSKARSEVAAPEPEPETLALEADNDQNSSDEDGPPPPPSVGTGRPSASKQPASKAPTTPIRPEIEEIFQRLHKCADTGDFQGLKQAVKQAVAARLDLNTRDRMRDNNTAVFLAAQGGHRDAAKMVEYLHQKGADLMLTGSMDATPLFMACYKGYHDVVGAIVDNLPDTERLRAVEDHEVDGVVKIKAGDIFQKDNPSDTGGIFRGTVVGRDRDWPREGAIRATLPGGIFQRTSERMLQLEKKVESSSPFFIACQEGHVAVAKILLDAGVDIEEPDGHGATPFYSACQHGHIDIARYLLGKENPRTGVMLDPARIIDVDGIPGTALDRATDGNHDDIVALLDRSVAVRHTAVPVRSAGVPTFDKAYDEGASSSDDEDELLPKAPGMGDGMGESPLKPPTPQPRGPGVLGGLETRPKEIKRGKARTLDLKIDRKGSVFSAGFLVEDEEPTEFEADGEEEDETRLRVSQLTRAVLFVGIAVFSTLSHFAPGLLVLTAILSVLLIAAPAQSANADTAPGLPGGKTQRTVPAVQLGLCLFISIFAGAAQFVPGVLVILSTLILMLLAAPASKDDGTKKDTWR